MSTHFQQFFFFIYVLCYQQPINCVATLHIYFSWHTPISSLQVPVRLKLSDQGITFRNVKTGKVESLSSTDLEVVNWQRLAGSYGLRIFTESGNLYRFGGFKESVGGHFGFLTFMNSRCSYLYIHYFNLSSYFYLLVGWTSGGNLVWCGWYDVISDYVNKVEWNCQNIEMGCEVFGLP